MIKVVHVIKSLELGGAETVLRRLIEGSDRERFSWQVISLTSVGPIGEHLKSQGFTVHALGLASPSDYAVGVPRLARQLRALTPHVVQTWMYHGDLVGGLAARLVGIRNVVWAIHAGSPPLADASTFERLGFRANALLSRALPARIICCSNTTRRVHAALGYKASKMVVVPNGFSVAEGGREVDASGDVPLVLRVGRDHPDKDIPTFVRAVRSLREEGYELKGLLVGPGLHRGNQRLVEEISTAGLSSDIDLLGPRDDIELLLRTASVAVSSSSGGEGLPLVVGEAMASGTPVVTTDVGDSALVLDDATRVVPPRDHVALALAIKRILDLSPSERSSLGARDKRIIAERWSLEQMITGYCDEYVRLAAGRGGGMQPNIVS